MPSCGLANQASNNLYELSFLFGKWIKFLLKGWKKLCLYDIPNVKESAHITVLFLVGEIKKVIEHFLNLFNRIFIVLAKSRKKFLLDPGLLKLALQFIFLYSI